ncbi:putative bifunctional protein Glutamate-1-semialdehyde 2,1-aminomutase/3-deoxy-manno-octulosonate cytidylyltransferase [gamma proteobacterium IMCC1989]|nr:putative bifunctional protein Glutamate-1-semialdehyde 2,1-aminomutase/3-deoxy-manno-octulosonate cytidylyltransferase [gamma proteobacterium IMCC1989]
MKVVAIVQARMGSKRLPQKVMKAIVEKPMIELLLRRLSKSSEIDEIVLATSEKIENEPLINFVNSIGFSVMKGSEEDVLDRFLQTALNTNADIIVRITGDCPLVDPSLVDKAIKELKLQNVDYLSNVNPPTYPDGLDVEVFTVDALKKSAGEATETFDREHVTPYIRNSGLFSNSNFSHSENYSQHRWTVDEPEDLDVITSIFEYFKEDIYFSWENVLELMLEKPNIFKKNDHLERNKGAQMSSGQKLWRRAKTVIPGGNMLLSKRAEMFLPEQWPAYFQRSQGCTVWDLDDKQYTDMSVMGIGTNILGYGHPEVDAAVQEAVGKGNMSTLNCPEEVLLAEKLISLHSWADMVRFARSGGEANAIAIRIARAASGKDKVAICGYHGWHDWYLSANLSDEGNLTEHLLPGLNPKGVPEALKDTVYPFNYNDFDGLEHLINTQEIGVIKMEVSRNFGPENDFLQKVRDLANKQNIVLIFDECTSGFRETLGGLHKKYGVEPDMAMFGKALGNGYAVTATIGRKEIMEAAQTTFISSTFWTERIGSVAALKTLEVMEREESWKTITTTGLDIRNRWQALADQYDLSISHWGLPALTGFTFNGGKALEYKTLITQELLQKGYLAANSIYVSTAHTADIINGYFSELEPVFKLINDCENGRDVNTLLKGPVCHGGFKRLN